MSYYLKLQVVANRIYQDGAAIAALVVPSVMLVLFLILIAVERYLDKSGYFDDEIPKLPGFSNNLPSEVNASEYL